MQSQNFLVNRGLGIVCKVHIDTYTWQANAGKSAAARKHARKAGKGARQAGKQSDRTHIPLVLTSRS